MENGITASKVKVTSKFKMSVNVCLDDIFRITELFFKTKFGMVMQHHESEFHADFSSVFKVKVKVIAKAHIIKI